MDDKARRKELVAAYKERQPEAGVYRIVNGKTNRSLVSSTANLPSIRSRFEFAKATNSPSALDGRLTADIRAYGLDAFGFEVLETVEVDPNASRAQVESDLATLEKLWREKIGRDSLY